MTFVNSGVVCLIDYFSFAVSMMAFGAVCALSLSHLYQRMIFLSTEREDDSDDSFPRIRESTSSSCSSADQSNFVLNQIPAKRLKGRRK